MEKKRDLIKLVSSLCYRAHAHVRARAHKHTHKDNSKSSLYIYLFFSSFFFFQLMYCIHIYSQYPPPPLSHTHTQTLTHCCIVLSLSHTHTHTNTNTLLHCTLSLSHTHTHKTSLHWLVLSLKHTQRKRVRHCSVLSVSAWERTQRWVWQVNVQPLQTRTNDSKNKWCHQAPDSSIQLSSGNLSPVNSLSELLPLTAGFHSILPWDHTNKGAPLKGTSSGDASGPDNTENV